jgi:hypothetical protein
MFTTRAEIPRGPEGLEISLEGTGRGKTYPLAAGPVVLITLF